MKSFSQIKPNLTGVLIWRPPFKKIKSQLPMQSVIITTDDVSSNLEHGEVYNIMW